MAFIFFASLAMIVYACVGYPLVLRTLAAVVSKPVKKADIEPSVTILILASDEDEGILDRISDLLQLDYPKEKKEIIVGSDGSTDETYRAIKKFADDNKVRYVVSFQKIGRPAMINKMAKEAQGDILVFAKARHRFERAALREIVKPFADVEVGGVSGVSPGGAGSCGGQEQSLMRLESSVGSTLGAAGAVYAIRKEYFRHLPQALLSDDVFTPMNALMMKKRFVFEPAAKASDMSDRTAPEEFSQKVKALLGDLQIFSLFTEAFNPSRSPVAFQLFSRKFLKIPSPYFLILLFISNIFLLGHGAFYGPALGSQIIFYSLAVLGYLLKAVKAGTGGMLRIFCIPYEFCALNAASVAALFIHLSGREDVRWEK